MWGILATDPRIKSRLYGAFALAVSLGLAGCSDLDNALFSDEPDNGGAPAASADQFPPATAPGTAGTLPAAPATAATGSAPVIAITPVTIEPGANTGTAVSATIAAMRSQLSTLEEHVASNAAHLTELRNQGADAARSYQEAKANITTRLQVGTTRGNPELVAQWNTAQGQLDALSANLNALNAVGTDVTNDSSSAHFALDQISATFNVSGAVDEDHRQLQLLEDETNQTIVLIDRLLKEVSDDVQRQTAYVANERGNLTQLSSAIKNGELYGGTPGVSATAASAGLQLSAAGSPLVVIRFDRANVDYQQILYTALNQALAARPNADFQ